MALSHSPSIVREGLVLHLDAANPKSYPGSGATWFDLSGKGNDGTLVNGVGYNSSNKGSLSFDGVDDYAFGNINSLENSEFTINIWLKTGNILTNQIILSIGTEPATRKSIHLRFRSSPTEFRFDLYSQSLDVTLPNTSDNFTNLVCTLNSNRLQSVYQNASFINSRTASSLYIGNNIYNLGRWGLEAPQFGYPGEYWNGNIYQASIYNRALSIKEIQQNFEATRDRYGI